MLVSLQVDGQFKAFAISLPSDSELHDALPAADPLLVHEVREFVTKVMNTGKCRWARKRALALAVGKS